MIILNKPNDIIFAEAETIEAAQSHRPGSNRSQERLIETAYHTFDVLLANADKAKGLVARLARDFPRKHEPCPIGSDRALDTAIITAPEARDPALLAKLDAVAGRVLGHR